MTLIVSAATAGVLTEAIVGALEEAGRAPKVVSVDHDDPLGEAVGHRAVVFVPATGEHHEVEAALCAAHAPGVEVLVAVLPFEGLATTADAIAADGVPYVMLRAPALLEELGSTLDELRWLLVSKDAVTRATDGARVAAAVRDALDTEEQGTTRTLGEEPIPVATALARAAAITGRRVRVVAVWPPLYRALRWLTELLAWRPRVLERGTRLALPPPIEHGST